MGAARVILQSCAALNLQRPFKNFTYINFSSPFVLLQTFLPDRWSQATLLLPRTDASANFRTLLTLFETAVCRHDAESYSRHPRVRHAPLLWCPWTPDMNISVVEASG